MPCLEDAVPLIDGFGLLQQPTELFVRLGDDLVDERLARLDGTLEAIRGTLRRGGYLA